MDFFQAQDDARARTRTLILLFVAAVVAINLAVYGVVLAVRLYEGAQSEMPVSWDPEFERRVFLIVTGLTTALIAGGSLVRTAQLKHGGGARVAGLLGASRLTLRGADKAERRLINVVEEMAIASGVPVPEIYVLDEGSINAFAAGYATNDAVVAVSRGAINSLNRDELQGVVAHEFSHILNGDMRLNIRLMGVLYGILLLTTIGRGIVRGSSRGNRRKGGGQAALLGFGLILVGSAGVFFGRLIAAATSRQREYLADASAVQFTRNPRGLAGALAKVKTVGSLVENHHAQEASHLFFAEGIKASFTSYLATHPPLPDRVRRIDPGFDLDMVLVMGDPSDADASEAPSPDLHAVVSGLDSMTGVQLMDSIGKPLPAHVTFARQLLDSLTDSVRTAAHEPDGATALLFALLMQEGPDAPAQRAAVVAHGGEALAGRVAALARDVATMSDDQRLSLLDLMQPALHDIAPDQKPRIHETARALVVADRKTDVFEYAVLHLVGQRLRFGAAPAKPAQPKASMRDDVQCVLSAVAWSGTDDSAAATRAFMAGVASLPRSLDGITLLPHDAGAPDALGAALGRLRVTKPGVRRTLLEACAHGVVASDARVHAKEAEVLRVIAESVDVPMPPVGESLAPAAGFSSGRSS